MAVIGVLLRLTDDAVSATARHHADLRPPLDEISMRALDERADRAPDPATQDRRAEASDAPDVILWATLSLAPSDGISVADLMNATGMSRRWIYYRLRTLADSGRVTQTEHGTWRMNDTKSDSQ